jgi:uncharacterized protein
VTRGAIVVFAKRPRPGEVKTRMTPPLSPEQAADLYAAMLRDVLAATSGFAAALELEPLCAALPPASAPELAGLCPPNFRVVAQRGPDLAARMDHAVREAAAAGARRVLLRGSDSPALDGDVVAEALEALDGVDLVLCPGADGGYDLVALRGPVPGLFDHPMSTPSVLADTLASAARRDLRVRLLEPRFDLDTVEDLRRLARSRTPRLEALCAHTFAFLDALSSGASRALAKSGDPR